jgi:hypothetical protein
MVRSFKLIAIYFDLPDALYPKALYLWGRDYFCLLIFGPRASVVAEEDGAYTSKFLFLVSEDLGCVVIVAELLKAIQGSFILQLQEGMATSRLKQGLGRLPIPRHIEAISCGPAITRVSKLSSALQLAIFY